MYKKIKYFITSIGLFLYPLNVFAQFQTGVTACDPNGGGLLGSDFSCTITRIIGILGILNPILFSLSFIVFFWGLTKFILNSDSKEEIESGKNYMLWAVLALFILISFRVIITFISNDLGIGDSNAIPYIPHG